MGSKQWFVILFISAIHFTSFSHRMDVVPFFIELKEVYQAGYTEIGGLISAFLLGYAFFQIPAGTLADRRSPRVLICAGLVTMLVASFLFVISHSLPVSLILRFIMGAAAAMIISPGIKLISMVTPKEKRGISIGILEGAAGMGMLLTLTVFPILSSVVSWRYLFFVLSLMILAYLLLFWKLPGVNHQQETAFTSGKVSFSQIFRNTKVLRLLGISFFGLFGLYSYLAWFPTYLQTVAGYSKQESGWIMAVVMIAQVVMAPVSGRISDWLGNRKIVLVIGSGLLLFSALWLLAFHHYAIYLIALLVGTGISWSMAPMLTLATEIVSLQTAGLVISVVNTVGQIGSALSGILFGMLFDAAGSFYGIWLSCAAAFAVRILFCLGDLEERGVAGIAETNKSVSS